MCDDPKKKRVPIRSFRFYHNGFCFLMLTEGDAADHPIGNFECKGSEYNRLGINAAARNLRVTPTLFCVSTRIGNSITASAPTIHVPQSSG